MSAPSADELWATPVELRAPREGRVVEIDWADGVTTRYPHVILRAFCPCAHCQGHQGPIRWAQDAPDEPLALLGIEEVGSYAVRLIWAGGHSTGLYTFRFLRGLGTISERPIGELKTIALAR